MSASPQLLFLNAFFFKWGRVSAKKKKILVCSVDMFFAVSMKYTHACSL